MKLGLQLNSFDWTGDPDRFADTLAEIARTIEEAGFDRIGVADHLWQHPIMGGPEANEPECYAILAFLAASTSRIKLTGMVTGVHFRYPGVLVKTVTTLDVLSRGHAWLGIGSGHYEEEARGLGLPFPPQKERFAMLEEAIQITLRMWSDEHPFEGKHYQLERPFNLPQSLTRPHPPIWSPVMASGRPCAWSRVTQTPAACVPARRSRSSSMLCADIARSRAGNTTRSRRPARSPSTSARMVPRREGLELGYRL